MTREPIESTASLTPFIEVAGVSKVYSTGGKGQVVALEDVSLDIMPGEFVSVLGPSGCGKSTLLMLIAGLYRPSAGEIRIADRRVTRAQTDLGMVFQSPVLLDWRTVLGNVLLQAEARRMEPRLARERALALLASVGLSGFERSYPYALSGGMRQRVSICRALVHDPPLLLMDEPFGALDALTREQLMIDLQRMLARTRQTVVFVTHSISEAVFQSDRVVVLSPRPGRVERIWTIDLPRPRRVRLTSDPAFSGYVEAITDLFMSKGVIREDMEEPSA
jgi:NitT/TauT family transport system ATP-binding protein